MITIEQIKQLREETQCSIADCRKALKESKGDYKKALELIKSIYENHPDAGTAEMPTIADLMYNQALNALEIK